MYFTKEQIQENINLLRECEFEDVAFNCVSKKFFHVRFSQIRSFLNLVQKNGTFSMIFQILREQYYNIYAFVAEYYKKDKMMHFLLEWDKYCGEVLKGNREVVVTSCISEQLQMFHISRHEWLDVFAAINEAVFELSQATLLDKQKNHLSSFL